MVPLILGNLHMGVILCSSTTVLPSARHCFRIDRTPALYQHVVLRLLSGRIPNPPYYRSPIQRGQPGQPKITVEGFGFKTSLMG